MNANPSSEWNRLRKAATHPDSIEENIEKARQMAILSGEFGEGPIRKRFNYILPRLSICVANPSQEETGQ